MLRALFFAIAAASLSHSEEAPGYHIKPVTIWSDGTRMAGDLYLPDDLKPDERRAAILFCAGTAGVKKGNGALYGRRFAKEGYIVLAFDYRGWGESDCKLMMTEPMPKADERGEVTVKARPVRWQMDLADQTLDIRCALSFLSGEPAVDPARIGLFGTSYGGGLVTWVAGNDSRAQCVVAQVPGMGGGRPPAAIRYAEKLAIQQARGETEPVPVETGKLGGKMAAYAQMRANPAKGIGYSPVDAAAKIKCPTLFIVAENEDLMSNEENGKKAFELMRQAGTTTRYEVIAGIGHYGVYQGPGFDAAMRLAIDWFKQHLSAGK